MSTRARRRAAGRAVGRRAPEISPKPRPQLRPLIVGGAVAVIALIVIAVIVLWRPAAATADGIQVSPPPWLPETAHLRDRLFADGLAALTAEGEVPDTHQHLDLEVDGRAVGVPADIGINAPGGFIAPIHTHDATGIIHVESPTPGDFTLGEFFDVWGVRFDSSCVGGLCTGSGRSLSVFVNGQAYPGDPRALVLAAHQEIVVAIGQPGQLPSPLPASYSFPAGL